MPVSETKRRNNDKYNAKCDRITVWPIKAKGAAIRGKRKRGKPARVYFGGGICQNGAGREAARDRPGGIRGRRGTIGGYWGEL